MRRRTTRRKRDPRLKRAGVSGYNKPKRTPGHPKKSHIVVAKVGKKIKTKLEIDIHIFCHPGIVNKYTIKTGKINSAVERPNQQVLNAFPLDLVKYLEIVVVAV